jgi:hypothetical protein
VFGSEWNVNYFRQTIGTEANGPDNVNAGFSFTATPGALGGCAAKTPRSLVFESYQGVNAYLWWAEKSAPLGYAVQRSIYTSDYQQATPIWPCQWTGSAPTCGSSGIWGNLAYIPESVSTYNEVISVTYYSGQGSSTTDLLFAVTYSDVYGTKNPLDATVSWYHMIRLGQQLDASVDAKDVFVQSEYRGIAMSPFYCQSQNFQFRALQEEIEKAEAVEELVGGSALIKSEV